MWQWFYMKGKQKHGPVNAATLRELAANGALLPTDRIWREGLSGWVSASQAKSLFPELPYEPVSDDHSVAATADTVPVTASVREEKACPFCGEQILVVAKKCKHCGEFLDRRLRDKSLVDLPPTSDAPMTRERAPTRATYNPGDDTFTGTMALVVKLAMSAVQELGWKLDNANENLGLVTFETGISLGSWGGVSCSLNITETSPNQFRVTGTGKQNLRGGQFIAINFGGEAQGKAQKAIDKMRELARKDAEPTTRVEVATPPAPLDPQIAAREPHTITCPTCGTAVLLKLDEQMPCPTCRELLTGKLWRATARPH
jgi:hypothetical protein